MTWSLWQLAKVTNVETTLADNGALETTYFLELSENTGVKPYVVIVRTEPITTSEIVQSTLSANLQEAKSINVKLNVI